MPVRFLLAIVSAAAAVLVAASAARHWLHQSNLFDLGIFDQAAFLISRGEPPIVTTQGFHILGDHAALVMYPIALLYRLWPDVAWLFGLQAIALGLTAVPLHALARQAGLDERWARTLAVCGLLYPAVFNVALYDFHPEALAVPALLWALWAGLAGRGGHLAIALGLVLACKEVLGLTVAFLGVLLWLKGRRGAGAIVAVAGLAWFGFAAGAVIPHFSGAVPAATSRYTWVLRAIGTNPLLVVERLVGLPALFYMALLLLPVAIGVRARQMVWALPAIPMLGLNLLATVPEQRDLIHQYTVEIFPFLLVWLIGSVAQEPRRGWLSPKVLLVWSGMCFLALAKYGYFMGLFLPDVPVLAAEKAAIRAISGPGGVLAPSHLGPHLSHRKTIEMPKSSEGVPDLAPYQYVVVNVRRPGWGCDETLVRLVLERALQDPERSLVLEQDGVYVFVRMAVARADSSVVSMRAPGP